MSGTVYELNPVSHITTGFIGQPGKRVFYLQATKGVQVVTLIVEKMQVEALSEGVIKFLDDLRERNPDLSTTVADYRAERMALKVPLDPIFRVGQIGLGYDETNDLMVLVAQEIVTGEREEEVEGDDVNVARLFATREQMLEMAEHGRAIVGQGRPNCPLCGQPIDPEGHFCPRRNGHRW
jgi:uncharacterized repeat protein (TIGR03847 family)